MMLHKLMARSQSNDTMSFNATNDWLYKSIQHYNVCCVKLRGRAGSGDVVSVNNFKPDTF